MPSLSIIVTAYNIEDYIVQCLESVAAQTLRDIEVLVVDDGSTDDTPARIAQFAAADPRFVPILLPYNSPGGVATAANAGLDRASADWVGFVDGDDYVEPGMFETLLGAATANDADLAICQYREVTDDGGEVRAPADSKRWSEFDAACYQLDVESSKQFLRFIAVPWRKLYRRSLLEEGPIRFPVGDYFYEDNPFHWFSILSAKSIAMVPQVLCYHRIGRPGQTMATADSRLFKIFLHHDTIRSWLRDKGLASDFETTLLGWVISQAEWISRRTPQELRRELYGALRPIFAQYPPRAVSDALREGAKSAQAHRLCAALVRGSVRQFAKALEGRPNTGNYLRLGLYHLRHSGFRRTLQLTMQTLRNRFGPVRSRRFRLRQSSGGSAPSPANADLMFGLMVLQRRLDELEAKIDDVRRTLPSGAAVAPSDRGPTAAPRNGHPEHLEHLKSGAHAASL